MCPQYLHGVIDMKKLNMYVISINRDTIYGLSILWIMLFHSTFLFSKPWMLPLARIKNIGNCGVDIFLFVSGICLFFSFSKGGSLKDFYLRRLRRVYLPTLLVTIPWFGFLAPYKQPDFLTFLLNATGLSLFVSGNHIIWFVVAILCFYAIYPLLYRAFEKTNHAIWPLLLMLGLSFLLNFAIRSLFPKFWEGDEILFRRVPIFLIGAYCGRFVYEKRTLPITHIQVIAITVLVTLVYFGIYKYWRPHSFQRYAYIVMAPCFTAFFGILGQVAPIRRVASWFAPITLELYLTHEKFLTSLNKAMPTAGTIPVNLAAFCYALAAALLLSYVEKAILRRPRTKPFT